MVTDPERKTEECEGLAGGATGGKDAPPVLTLNGACAAIREEKREEDAAEEDFFLAAQPH